METQRRTRPDSEKPQDAVTSEGGGKDQDGMPREAPHEGSFGEIRDEILEVQRKWGLQGQMTKASRKGRDQRPQGDRAGVP